MWVTTPTCVGSHLSMLPRGPAGGRPCEYRERESCRDFLADLCLARTVGIEPATSRLAQSVPLTTALRRQPRDRKREIERGRGGGREKGRGEREGDREGEGKGDGDERKRERARERSCVASTHDNAAALGMSGFWTRQVILIRTLTLNRDACCLTPVS